MIVSGQLFQIIRISVPGTTTSGLWGSNAFKPAAGIALPQRTATAESGTTPGKCSQTLAQRQPFRPPALPPSRPSCIQTNSKHFPAAATPCSTSDVTPVARAGRYALLCVARYLQFRGRVRGHDHSHVLHKLIDSLSHSATMVD